MNRSSTPFREDSGAYLFTHKYAEHSTMKDEYEMSKIYVRQTNGLALNFYTVSVIEKLSLIFTYRDSVCKQNKSKDTEGSCWELADARNSKTFPAQSTTMGRKSPCYNSGYKNTKQVC